MVDVLKGWLKIYLFYGVIFFLLGLFGYLATDEVRLATWSHRQIQRISRTWSAMIFHESNDQVAPAFSSQIGSIVLRVYPHKEANRQLDNLVQQLQNELQSRFQQVIILPVDDLNELNLEHDNHSTPWILVGFNQTKNPGRENEVLNNCLYFSMADQTLYLLAGKVIQAMSGKLSAFTFSKKLAGKINIFELNWNTLGNSEVLNDEVFSAFIKIMTKDSFEMITNKTLD